MRSGAIIACHVKGREGTTNGGEQGQRDRNVGEEKYATKKEGL